METYKKGGYRFIELPGWIKKTKIISWISILKCKIQNITNHKVCWIEILSNEYILKGFIEILIRCVWL